MKNFTSKLTIAVASVGSLLVFSWPLLIQADASLTTSVNQAQLAQSIFIVLMPLLIVTVLVEFSSGKITSRQLAVLGVLTALNAVIRLAGAGTSGIETAFFLIILGAYVFGAGFGFLLATGSILVSALISGGVGPWLPFQMMAAGLVGIGAALLPHPRRDWAQRTIIIAFAVPASFFYGALMTMWNWPFLAGTGTNISYLAGAGLIENLRRFLNYELLTGGLVWDSVRAITTVVLLLLTAPALLATLNRAANRAGFEKLNR
jgi:energy-coupling factor transport system substrate-specific component